jgi:hypothetical protein
VADYTDRYIADVTRYVTNVERAGREADEFGRSQTKAGLAARKMALAADEAGDKAAKAQRKAAAASEVYERAQKEAADAARMAARGGMEAAEAAKYQERANQAGERAAEAAARAMRELARADLAQASAAMASASATDKQADQMRQLDRASTSAVRGLTANRSTLLSLIATGGLLTGGMLGPATVGFASLAAESAGAAVALGAFGAAVKPQLATFKEVAKAQDAYNEAVREYGKGSKEAKEAAKAFGGQLKRLPPATREAALSFTRLRTSYKQWSDALAKDTMPLFTKGMDALRRALPSLTPLVKTASAALGSLVDRFDAAVDNGSVDRFLDDLNELARDSLPHLLNAAVNVGKGIGQMFMAFGDLTLGDFSRGIEDITAKFADWATSMRGSPEFAAWVARMKAELPGILSMLGNLASFAAHVAQALGPMAGASLHVAEALAAMVNAIPQGALNVLAPTIMGIVIATKAWGAANALTTGSLGKMGGMLGPIGVAFGALTVAAGLLVKAGFPEKLREWEHSLGQLHPALMGASMGLRTVFGGLGATSTATGQLDGALVGLINHMNALRQASLAAMNSEIGFEAAVDAASASVRANGRTLDVHTAKGRANKQAVLGIGAAALQMAEDARKSGGDVNAAMNRGYAAFIKAARGAGMSKAAAAALARQIGLVPGSKTTKYKDNAASAAARARRVRDAINSIRDKTVTVRVNYVQLGASTGRGGALIMGGRTATGGYIDGMAAGGPVAESAAFAGAKGMPTGGMVFGQGTGTSDDIPRWLSRGEYVINAAATRQWRTVLDAINYGTARSAPSMTMTKSRGGDGAAAPIIIHIAGSVVSERNLVEQVRKGLAMQSTLQPGRNGTVTHRTLTRTF